MNRKPITPYQRLLTEFREFASKIYYPHTKTMWVYPKGKLGERWNLYDLAERTAAAEQLGYDVVLKYVNDGDNPGLCVQYRKKPPLRPWVVA
jgi:hypothetical protein